MRRIIHSAYCPSRSYFSARSTTVLLSAIVTSSSFWNQPVNGFPNKGQRPISTSPEDNINSSMKSASDLQIQWAGGRDVWPEVPAGIELDKNFVSIQTKVRDNSDIDSPPSSKNNWPHVVKSSVLFGFGAYNPRGQNLPFDVNEKQHALLKQDIEASLSKYPLSSAMFWEAAAIWEDQSYEKGFILAFQEEKDEGLVLSKELARKYDQGALYQYQLQEDGRMIRETIPVLDEGTDARVEIEIDDSVDRSPFL